MALQQDSTYLPLRDNGQSLLDVELPQYYREGFFSNDTLFHPELPGGRFGVGGDPMPYSIHNDNVITSILLVFFILMVIAISYTRNIFVRFIKKSFYMSNQETPDIDETGTEIRFQLFLVFLNCVMLSLLFYFYTINHIGDNFILKSQYLLIAIYLAIVICYFLVSALSYSLVNWVFFDSKRNRHWTKIKLILASAEGILLFPIVLLQAYFNMSEKNVILYFIIVLLFVKILTIFKCYVVFFRRNVVELQIILYFCALEIVPLLATWGALDFVTNSLRIIF